MSEPINDGGPAFPHLHNTCQRLGESEMFPGMSLRDWFAGQALSALLAMPEMQAGIRANELSVSEIAGGCYEYADAMLAARDGAK